MPRKGPSTIQDRLSRVQGQINGIDRMIESGEKSSRDIVIQVQAAISALEGVNLEMVKKEVKEALLENMDSALSLLK